MKRVSMKEMAEIFYQQFSTEEIDEILSNEKLVLPFIKHAKVPKEQRIENEAIKLLNKYYTSELKKALKQYKPNETSTI